jgi:hypothetical protein
MDTAQVIIIVLTAFTAIVWAHSWIHDDREERENQPEERTTPLYHGQAMLGAEEF